MFEFESFISVKPLEGTLVIHNKSSDKYCFYQDRGDFIDPLILSSDKLIRERLDYIIGKDWEFEIDGALIFSDGETNIFWMDA